MFVAAHPLVQDETSSGPLQGPALAIVLAQCHGQPVRKGKLGKPFLLVD